MASITASVGRGGVNHRQDVITVQTLLNQHIGQLVPLRSLTINGHCGPETVTLIEEFQRRVVGMVKPDGRVDPSGQTLTKLNSATPVGLSRTITLTGNQLPAAAEKVLKDILAGAGLATAEVTSVSRTPAEQARVMYDNCVRHGAAYNKRMYAAAGDKVVQVYEDNHDKPRDTVIALMLAKINEVGPTKVSQHISDTHYTFDVAPSSIPVAARPKFVAAIKAHKAVSKLIPPPVDPAYHIEIPKNSPHL